MTGSWTDEWTGEKLRDDYTIKDFTPISQDRFAIATIKKKASVRAYDDIINGNFKKALGKMSNEWRCLPGPVTQSKLTTEDALKQFNEAKIDELNGKSDIATPKGELLKGF